MRTISLAVILLLPCTATALDCPPPPRPIAAEEVSALDAWTSDLIDAIGTPAFDPAQSRVGAAFRRDHASEDDLEARLILMHAVCARLASDGTLIEARKREKLIEFEQEFELRNVAGSDASERLIAVQPDDAFTEAVLMIRTADAGRNPAATVRVELLVDGSPAGETRVVQRPTVKGDLETVRVRLTPPVSILDCRDLSLDVRLEDHLEGWTFNLVSVVLKTQKGQTFFDLFEPVGPIALDADPTTKTFDFRVESCRRRSL